MARGELGINELTIGVSTSGVDEYLSNLRQDLLVSVSDKIDAVANINNALNKGWQGESREVFERIFAQRREEIKNDLASEYRNVSARLEELANNYINQDKQMIIE